MTKELFHKFLKEPENFSIDNLSELKDMVMQYPYFAQAQVLLAKALTDSKDLQASQYCEFASIYAADRQHYFFTLYPEKKQLAEPVRIEREIQHTGDYFSLIEKTSSHEQDSKQSLKSLAERLKAARENLHPSEIKPTKSKINNINEVKPEPVQLAVKLPEPEKTEEKTVEIEQHFSVEKNAGVENNKNDIIIENVDYFRLTNDTFEMTEENAKKLIKEHKYVQAIAILKELNLNNPKKSIYFADQIRFLEKIIEIKKNKQ